jgi:hypothetical protein
MSLEEKFEEKAPREINRTPGRFVVVAMFFKFSSMLAGLAAATAYGTPLQSALVSMAKTLGFFFLPCIALAIISSYADSKSSSVAESKVE